MSLLATIPVRGWAWLPNPQQGIFVAFRSGVQEDLTYEVFLKDFPGTAFFRGLPRWLILVSQPLDRVGKGV